MSTTNLLGSLATPTPSAGFLEPDADAIPIFSEQFLEHNRQREAELRQLRKASADFDEQNAMLSKHIESMNAAIEQLEREFVQQRGSQALAAQRLGRMRQLLCAGLADLPVPGTGELPTLPTIDGYVQRLQARLKQMPAGREQEQIQARVQSVLAKLDL